jgi:hypothetical protein
MKQTKADKDFALRFADALGPHVASEREKGESLASIAKRLGISGPGLLKQLNGGTPSVRTIALAHTSFGISVPYAGVDVAKAVSSKRRRRPRVPDTSQLLLPFEITTPPSSQRLVLKLVPKSARRYHLQLMVKMSA